MIAAISAAALGTSALAACGSDNSGGSGDALEVWVYQDASTAVQEQFIEQFNETSDIKINLTQIPGDNYQDKTRTSLGTPNAPDIFFNWGGGSISDFVEQDMLLDLTDILNDDLEFKQSFIPSILDAGRIDQQYYGIPMRGVQPVLLFHNKEVFEAAGVEPPKTMDDIWNLVEVFQAEGVVPFVLAGADPWTEQMWMQYLLDRYGSTEVWQRIQNADSEAWGDPAMLWAAETVQELVEAGAFGNNFRSMDYVADGASTFFAQGGAAMHLMGSWEFSNQKSNQPDFADNNLGWTAFPEIEEGIGDPSAVTGNPTNFWSVNANVQGERQEAAIEFLKMAGDDSYAEALIANGDVPATSNAEALLEKHENPEYAAFQYELVREASNFTLSWDQALPARPATTMINNIEQLFNGQITPQEFVDAMQDV
ncbi:extracellular solute-binding protein [Streptomyces sp. ACA25]|uniref:extracellular solute-binding protein n=1 Tax=Streptomyces sp. ACA25 TaxID=3022596 RepID=UPI002307BE0A|nr:extracellular solute-binding protein [Streptomyces sp. ACA25]MDB1088260.1 extracellular solute-binding protein [Streptomyces sp. ACA25]